MVQAKQMIYLLIAVILIAVIFGLGWGFLGFIAGLAGIALYNAVKIGAKDTPEEDKEVSFETDFTEPQENNSEIDKKDLTSE